MLNTAQTELFQQFLTMPDPTYATMFELQAEVEDLTEQLEVKAAEYEALEDDLKDAAMKADDDTARINELESALADALVWIAAGSELSVLAETDSDFKKLFAVL